MIYIIEALLRFNLIFLDNLNSEKDEPNKNTTNQKNSTIEASLNTDEKVKVSRTTSNATEKGNN